MAKTSTLTLTISIVGDGVNELIGVPPQALKQYTNQAAPGGVPQPLVLVTGFNAIPIPAGSQGGPGWFIYEPPAGSVITKTLKGVIGDVGKVLHLTNPTILPIAVGETFINITAGGAGETGSVYWL
jgi:hypothetical protein